MVSVALAEALVERFRLLVPADVLVMNDQDMVVLRRDATHGWIGVGLDVKDTASDLEIERATHGALRALQEFMCEQFGQPWPTPVLPSGASPVKDEAGVCVEASQIHLWFGDADAPALRLASIDRDTLR